MRKLLLSLLGLVSAAVYTVHSVYAAGLMTGIFGFTGFLPVLGRILATVLIIHAAISMPPALIRTFGSRHKYAAENRKSYIQYTSGGLLIFYVFYHPYYATHRPSLLLLMVLLLTLLATGVHIYIGLQNSMITLGIIRNEGEMSRARIMALLLAGIPTLLSAAAYISYYPQYYGGH